MAKQQGIRIIKVRERKTDTSEQIPTKSQGDQVAKDSSRQMAAVISSWVREIQGRSAVRGKQAFR
jgi:hypothetical protein